MAESRQSAEAWICELALAILSQGPSHKRWRLVPTTGERAQPSAWNGCFCGMNAALRLFQLHGADSESLRLRQVVKVVHIQPMAADEQNANLLPLRDQVIEQVVEVQ